MSGTGQKVLLSDLQNFLSGLQASNDGNVSGRTVDLASAINAEALDKITTEAEQSKYFLTIHSMLCRREEKRTKLASYSMII